MSLEKELKDKMGYNEEIHNCGNCKHMEEKENPMLDRDWITMCKYNKILSFKVSRTASCNYWE